MYNIYMWSVLFIKVGLSELMHSLSAMQKELYIFRGVLYVESRPVGTGGAGGASAPPIFCNYLLFKISRKHCKTIL